MQASITNLSGNTRVMEVERLSKHPADGAIYLHTNEPIDDFVVGAHYKVELGSLSLTGNYSPILSHEAEGMVRLIRVTMDMDF